MAQVTLNTGNETFERRELRTQFRRLLAKSWGDERIRQYADGHADCGAELARSLRDDMALHALTIPVDQGGLGGGCVEAAIAAEELGAAMAPSRLLATTMVAHLLSAARGSELAELLPRIADGVPGTLLWSGDDAVWDVRQAPTATVSGRAVHGTFAFVPELENSGLLLVPVRDGERYGIAVAGPGNDAPGIQIRPMRVLDVFRPLTTVSVSLEDVEHVSWTEPGPLFSQTLAAGAIVLAAEMIGASRACLERMAIYAQQRHQFGRPIGTFQALKHRIVDVLVSLEASRALTYRAAGRFDDMVAGNADAAEGITSARMAKAAAGDTLRKASKECLQVHGGIGFTWENPLHFYLKRWASSARLLGSPNQLRALVYRSVIGAGKDTAAKDAAFEQLGDFGLEHVVETHR
ncbi:hypothetical protein BST20_06460 [Mycobacterium branderi]|uniref:Acyl-CoA dehydrogenase n=1 Tax=Mycobacterium branderi TaxID=43348 RepID=A0A7I7WD87_9MYCO|nr:acyl-CoA/acyl-ACP dehydrogenase [Mycobacterium branderi]ORA40206.1 hypothetical protein BST20_06460 [Mycobacterium branderi]BBZ15496.1 acyl-CoA dehydrogenase [Mycobacterium branderi]